MMIKIKMGEPGSQELEDAIQDVNRRAKSHTFAAHDLAFYVTVEAERRLEKLGIPKAERAGARSVSYTHLTPPTNPPV